MPLVSIPTDRLQQLIGRKVPRDQLLTALERLGNDVEGYAVLSRYKCAACGHITEALEHEAFNNRCAECGSADLAVAGWSEVVRINLLPVRPDMFDAAGLARALKGILGIATGLPEYAVAAPALRVRVRPGLEGIRPHIVAAVARGLRLDDESVKLLMKLQEHLHWALGRDRRRASIGVYDLAAVAPDFEYRPVAPDGVRFVPLFGMAGDRTRAATPAQILADHPKGAAYRHLLASFDRYPLIADSQGRVLSLPPIINSDETRVTERTQDLFIDVTGPDPDAIRRALCVICAALADLGARLEAVTIEHPDGSAENTPDLGPRTAAFDATEARRVLGFDATAEEMAGLLGAMRCRARAEGERVVVEIPAYRSDVMHACDLMEDVAIARGFPHFTPRLLPGTTAARPQPVEELSRTCRAALTGLGFLETMTLVLTSREAHFTRLQLPTDTAAVEIENPASVEQAICRRHLLSGLLETFRINATAEMPQRIFEVGDVFELDPMAETGVRMTRRCGIGIAGPRAGFADIRAATEALTRELDRPLRFEPTDHPTFIPGRCARIVDEKSGADLGVTGEVHPEVLEANAIAHPVTLAELNLSLLL